MNRIGTIKQIFRFPVKSMAGEELERVLVSYSGIQGDRVYGLVQPGKRDNFPWMTAREASRLLLYHPRFVHPPSPETQYPLTILYKVHVRTPTGDIHDIETQEFMELLQKDIGQIVTLRFSEKGMQDARPISMISLNSISKIEQEHGRNLDPRRFRANFYVEWEKRGAFFEDTLIDKVLRIGETCRIMVSKKDPRCAIINLDPDTARSDPGVLRLITREHGNCLGIYGIALREGIVQRGEPIFVE